MAQKQYLDNNGNPMAAGKQYLDDNGNPVANPANLTPEMRENLARNASPTQFEVERNKDFQPGFGGRVADVVRSAGENVSDSINKFGNPLANQPLSESLKIGSPVDRETIKHDADVGDTAGIVGDVFPQIAMAAGALASPVIGKGVERTASFLRAPSDPNALYHSYLDPVGNQAHPVPSAPEPVSNAVLRDMEAAGDGAAAARIASGRATLSDMDTARQSANRLSKSIYRSPGNYPPGMAKGADSFAGSLRDKIYPSIEEAHGLEPGSLRGIKNLQGQMMEAERYPSLPSRIIRRGIGGAGGGLIGYKIAGAPGAIAGSIVGEETALPIAQAVDRGIIGFRTKTLASRLPQPRTFSGAPPVVEGEYVGPTDYKPTRGIIGREAPPTANRTFFFGRSREPLSLPAAGAGTQNAKITPIPVEPLPDNPTQPPQRTVFREPQTGRMKRGYTSGGRKMAQ